MASANISNTSDSSFADDVLDSETPVLVDFWAVWCGPCRAIAPHLEVIADQQGTRLKVVKLNIDENRDTAIKYQVQSIPTLLLFKHGEIVDKMVGNPGSRSKIEQWISPHLG
ncbi:MAG: thioredoxin [Myxococcales bacterium]|nr:thioredoxin [Myxococcales bacterium]